jgi:hypothetical protein
MHRISLFGVQRGLPGRKREERMFEALEISGDVSKIG